jgi:hypothetical protein
VASLNTSAPTSAVAGTLAPAPAPAPAPASTPAPVKQSPPSLADELFARSLRGVGSR